jgi:hypothetical protein
VDAIENGGFADVGGANEDNAVHLRGEVRIEKGEIEEGGGKIEVEEGIKEGR